MNLLRNVSDDTLLPGLLDCNDPVDMGAAMPEAGKHHASGVSRVPDG